MMDTELLKILIDRANYINTHWNIYIAVVTTIIGILAAGKINITRNIRTVFTVVFIIFAFVNYDSIRDVNRQRDAIANTIECENVEMISDTFKPSPQLAYLLFHLILDVSVLFAIWKFSTKTKED